MRDDNVVPFDPAARGGMARRGAADKNGHSSAEAIALQCPSCASELRLEVEWLQDHTDVLCGSCETEIPLLFLKRESGAG